LQEEQFLLTQEAQAERLEGEGLILSSEFRLFPAEKAKTEMSFFTFPPHSGQAGGLEEADINSSNWFPHLWQANSYRGITILSGWFNGHCR